LLVLITNISDYDTVTSSVTGKLYVPDA